MTLPPCTDRFRLERRALLCSTRVFEHVAEQCSALRLAFCCSNGGPFPDVGVGSGGVESTVGSFSVDLMQRQSTLPGMCKLSKVDCLGGLGAGGPRRAILRRFSGLLVLALLLGLCHPAQADLGDDQYLQIYGLIQQADELNASGKASSAFVRSVMSSSKPATTRSFIFQA